MTMAPKSTRRRSPGEGGAFSYKTTAGERWYWKATVTQPDGSTAVKVKRGFETKKAALAGLREALTASEEGGYAQPSKQLTGPYLDEWAAGLRQAPSTVASYRKNIRLHIKPRIGDVPLDRLTPATLDRLYRELEKSGRADHREGEGLSPRTVRYIHTILSAALRKAVKDGLLPRNPAATAEPPTAKQAKSPEMHPWNDEQLAAFLAWSRDGGSDLHAAWRVLAYTGMLRGELLALRWRDTDLDAGTITVRRSAGVIRNAGEGARIEEGATKTNKPRVVDLDPGTVKVLQAWRWERELLATPLARDGALVFGDLEGGYRHPERFSRLWNQTVTRAISQGTDVTGIRLHDLRHTHATLLLRAGEPVHVVSQRLGHASPTITMTVYAHALPGDQKRAASRFAELVREA
jgi:integrase